MFNPPDKIGGNYLAKMAMQRFLKEYDIESIIPEFMYKMEKQDGFGKLPLPSKVWLTFPVGQYKYTILRERMF